jgi:SAM-dependent methyltransferase
MRAVAEGHYARKQLGCRSAIIRWSHSARFRLAAKLAGVHPADKLLDYGCGDGTFIGMVADNFATCVGADTAADQLEDCRDRFEDVRNVRFCLVTDLASAEHVGAYAVVTCMETLEHCLEPVVERVLADLQRLCAPDGLIVISVPIETGLVFWVKYVVRKLAAWRGLGHYDQYEAYSVRDALRMAFANDDTAVARPVYGPPDSPYHSHYGFNWRVLRRAVARRLDLERTLFTPAGWLGGMLSSQVWFVCKPKRS